jgi:hypothetical protein
MEGARAETIPAARQRPILRCFWKEEIEGKMQSFLMSAYRNAVRKQEKIRQNARKSFASYILRITPL